MLSGMQCCRRRWPPYNVRVWSAGGVSVKRDGPTSLALEFASSPVYGEEQEFRVTRLRFQRIIEYGWNSFEFHRFISNPNDVEFALIEIVDSAVLADLRSTGRPIPGEVHHFRICFDDHGTYD